MPVWPVSGCFLKPCLISSTFNHGPIMMTLLFFLALAVFGYLVYVLLRPEKF
ncbi:potassium-transporting ATPase subunit F [Adhaeribacter swui]|nr:potassium-transporting ATPase subunit F [Adhaeribacter swui]